MASEGPPAPPRNVNHDVERKRFTVFGEDAGDKGVLYYERDSDRLYLIHTEVRGGLRGQGAAGQLITAALELARDDDLAVVPWCPFARRWLHEHPEDAQATRVDYRAGLPDRFDG